MCHRIYLYSKIAVELDGNGHSDRNIDYEIRR